MNKGSRGGSQCRVCGGSLVKIVSLLSSNSNILTELVCEVGPSHRSNTLPIGFLGVKWFFTRSKNRWKMTYTNFCDILIFASCSIPSKIHISSFFLMTTKWRQKYSLAITTWQNWNCFSLFSRPIIGLQLSLVHTENITGPFIKIILTNYFL